MLCCPHAATNSMKSWAFWWHHHQKVYSNISVTCYLTLQEDWYLRPLNGEGGWGSWSYSWLQQKKKHVLWLRRANLRNVMFLNKTNHRHSWLPWTMGHALVCWKFVKGKLLLARARLHTKTKPLILLINPLIHSLRMSLITQGAECFWGSTATFCDMQCCPEGQRKVQDRKSQGVPPSTCLLTSKKSFCVLGTQVQRLMAACGCQEYKPL